MNGYQITKDVAQYTLLPGIVPRVRRAFDIQFPVLAAAMASCLALVKLLPAGHPYLGDDAYGTFGLRDVVSAAYRSLRFDRQHIDQVIIFGAIALGLVAFAVMMVLTLLYGIILPASAQGVMPTDTGGLMARIFEFTATPRPEHDSALMLLDRVLGVTGNTPSGSFFGSGVPNMCVRASIHDPCITPPPPFPGPFHKALHAILGFYSMAILFVAVLIFLYFIFTLVYDMSATGKPFAARFNRFWMPIRLVVALGMLMPLSPHGLNSAQYIVLYTAKVSSAFATNGWLYYLQFIRTHMGGDTNPMGIEKYTSDAHGNLVAVPDGSVLAAKLNAPDMGDLVRFLHLVTACEYYNETLHAGKKLTYKGQASDYNIQGYFVHPSKEAKTPYIEPGAAGEAMPFKDAIDYFGKGTQIRVVFGERADMHAKYPSSVKPICGELLIPMTLTTSVEGRDPNNVGEIGVDEWYYIYVFALLDKTMVTRQLMDGFAAQMIGLTTKIGGGGCVWDTDKDGINNYKPLGGGNLEELKSCKTVPPASYMQLQVERFQGVYQALVNAANIQLARPANFSITDDVRNRGWVAASSWLHGIADKNGKFVSAVQQIPMGSRLPEVMEQSQLASIASAQNVMNLLDATKGSKKKSAQLPNDLSQAKALGFINQYLYNPSAEYGFKTNPNAPAGESGVPGDPVAQKDTQNPIQFIIGLVLGQDFLLNLCDNKDTHPYTQLVTRGRVFLERAGNNLMTAGAIGGASGVIALGNKDMSGGLTKTADAFSIVGMIFFSAGFMLFYVLPLLPFVYFFFAMLAWVKAVFEALIGAPLWAFAHLRLEGDGLPSKASVAGYRLLLEILLRPILTVMGLLAAMAIFTATVYAINDMWEIILTNLNGDTASDCGPVNKVSEMNRNLMDKFFYTIVYVLIIYMVANSSFKLIDMIPNTTFNRWSGGNAKSFAAMAQGRDHTADNFIQTAFIGIEEPTKKLVEKIDESMFSVTNTAAKWSDESSGGAIRAAVQDIFGRDREGRAMKPFDDMADRHLDRQNAVKDAEGEMLNLQNEKAEYARRNEPVPSWLTDQEKALEAKIKQLQLEAAANDPELVLDLLLNEKDPSKAKMPQEAREMILAQNNKEELKRAMGVVQEGLMSENGIANQKSKSPNEALKEKVSKGFAEHAKKTAPGRAKVKQQQEQGGGE